MAKIPAGILSAPSGKLGAVVGASWKGIPYLREYVIPANPNTASQQVERQAFSDLVSMAKTLLGSVLQPYWDPFLTRMSGWAKFIGLNRKLYLTPDDYSTVTISQGILEGAVIATADYITTTVTFTWSSVVLGNGSATDVAVAYVYDEVNKVGFVDDSATRTDAGVSVTVGTGRTASNLNAFLFFVDSKTALTMKSFSDFSVVT